MAHDWYRALHLIGLFFWIGSLLMLSRYMTYVARQESDEIRLAMAGFAKRSYRFITMPGGLMTIAFGLLMFLGVSNVHDSAISYYLKPKVEGFDGEMVRSYWYISFHIKLPLVLAIFAMDIWLGRKIGQAARGNLTTQPSTFTIVHGLMGLFLIVILIVMVAKIFVVPLGTDA